MLCSLEIPLLAITGTADKETQRHITQLLTMSKTMVKIFVSPNRVNLKFTVCKVKKSALMDQLSWIIEEVKQKGLETPQTIIFCCTLKDIASVVNWLLMMLENKAFYPNTSTNRKDCLIGIYHSLILNTDKERIAKDLKEGGTTRIVLATTALSMGVNFPNIRRVIMYGPPRTILDFHQEAGRAGRDDLPVLLFYHGQKSTNCQTDIKQFLNNAGQGCVRVAAYQSLDENICPLSLMHDCCNVCKSNCDCGTEECTTNTNEGDDNKEDIAIRIVNTEDRVLLKDALMELQESIGTNTMSALGGSHGFSSQLVEEVLENCDKIFSLQDVTKLVPVFSRKHVILIFEIFNDIFDDCLEMKLQDLSADVYSFVACDIQFLLGSDYEEDEVVCHDFDLL